MGVIAQDLDYPPFHQACLALVLFVCALLLAFVDKQVMALLVEPLKRMLSISDTQIGLLQGLAFSLFSAVAGLPLGRLVDRVNRVRLLVVCILIWSLMTMLCGAANGFATLFALRVGVGIGEACIYPLLYSIIADLFPRRTRATAMVLFYLACTVGTNLALAAVGSVIGVLAHGSGPSSLAGVPYWRLTYLLLGAPGPLLALSIALWVREPTRKETAGQTRRADLRAVIGHLWRKRAAFTALIAGWASVVAAANAIIAWYPSVMVRHFGLTAAQAGVRYGVFVAAAAVIAVPISALIERRVCPEELPKFLIMGLLASFAAVFAFPWATSANAGLSLIMLQYIGFMWIVGLTPVLLQDISPNEFRGQIFAIAALCSTILQGLTPVIVGFLSDRVLSGERALALSILCTIAPLLGIVVCLYLPLPRAFTRARRDVDERGVVVNKSHFTVEQTVESPGAALVRSALVWDECISWTSMDLVGADKSIKHQALPQYRDAGVNVASLTIGGDYGTEFQRSRGWLASERRYINEQMSEVCLLIRHIDDIEKARRENKLAITFHFQGATPFLNLESEEPGNMDLVSLYYDLGVRRALLAHNHRNALADGCKEPDNAGLSLFGKRIVKEMARVGMVLDCTHMGERSSLEAMELFGKPCVFSHSNAARVFPHPRNISDPLIKACAETGGVIGLTGWGPIVNERNDPSAEAIAQHVYHVADLVGPQHVGIGLDYVYVPELTTKRVKENAQLYAPLGSLEQYNYHHELQRFAPPTTFAPLADVLLKRMSEPEVCGILGENWLRVAAANWR